jgi:mono/diheme cytochrome c family protein
MKTKIIWTLFMVSLGTSSFLAQEKQPPQEKPPAAPTTAAPATTTVPHTYQISQEQKERKNPVRLTDFSAGLGKKHFLTDCAMCHGENADGKGDLAVEMKLHPPDLHKPEVLGKRTDGELFVIISGGSDTMPGENTRMTEKQRWQIINYLRTLEGKTPAKATDKEKEEEGTVIPHQEPH